MASRIRLEDLGGEDVSRAHAEVRAAHNNITPELVDRAVDETFRNAGMSKSVQDVTRQLMMSDVTSTMARAYFHGRVAQRGGARVTGVTKLPLDVPYVLDDRQSHVLVQYAPDFALRFKNTDSHDHPAAAASRLVDRIVVESRLPPGAAVSHVGGAVLPLITSGRLGKGHHACMPILDPKDPTRHVIDRMLAEKVVDSTKSTPAVRAAARGYLDGCSAHVCNQLVQDCSHVTPAITAVHVYDVPMEDWAGVMDRKQARVLEGCLTFPAGVYSQSHGEMPAVGARFEVDAIAGTFRMGFLDSPAWWYEHDLRNYLRYGADQILCAGGHTYSYKVVERRGDTLFYRILRVGKSAVPQSVQHYRTPGVPMVSVSGFPVVGKKNERLGHSRRQYLFPRALWEDMLAHAKDCVERRVITPERMFSYYRTVAPRQSINAVVVSGGVQVEQLSDLVPLVAHVTLFAFMEVQRSAAEQAKVVDGALHDRRLEAEGTMYKVMAAFGEALWAAAGLSLSPFMLLKKILNRGVDEVHSRMSYDWDVAPLYQTMPVGVVLDARLRGIQADEPEEGFEPYYAAEAPMDLVRSAVRSDSGAQFMLDVLGPELPEDLVRVAKQTVERSTAAKPPGDAAVGATEPESDRMSRVETLDDVDRGEVERRRASVLEAIVECEAEASKCEAACADQYRRLFSAGEPNRARLAEYREMYHNPEFWYVTGGVIERSFSGAPVDGFMHAAVFCPTPEDGERLCIVSEDVFKGMSGGEYVERVHYQMSSDRFTGWVYTNDSLLIYNGPALVEALTAALSLPMDFSVVLNQGPPGCGKTTSIVREYSRGDVVLVPVKKAARETAVRLADERGDQVSLSTRSVLTLDSYLVNVLRSNRMQSLRPARLLADEAFMAREGRWLAAAALLRVGCVYAYGDIKQIPHVPRAECPKLYVRLRHTSESAVHVSYRCPPESVACWGSVYEWRVRSASRVAGTVARVDTTVGLDVPDGCVMMGMYQADKKLLAEKYGRYGSRVRIMTVHESEGNTYRDVWLHRFDVRRRTDNFSLYDKQEYALVAMSRNTHSFLYVSPDLDDQVCKFINAGKDPRRVSAVRDVESAGRVQEFL